jgi:quercetin dioxygenase-like cupin family protein
MDHFFYMSRPLGDIGPDAPGAKRRWLVNASSGAEVSVMFVEVAPGGSTLRHAHPYEHTMFFLEGNGELVEVDGVRPINPYEVVHIAPDELHQIKNTGERILKFLAVELAKKEEKKD